MKEAASVSLKLTEAVGLRLGRNHFSQVGLSVPKHYTSSVKWVYLMPGKRLIFASLVGSIILSVNRTANLSKYYLSNF